MNTTTESQRKHRRPRTAAEDEAQAHKKAKPAKKAAVQEASRQTQSRPRQQEGRGDRDDEARQRRDAG